VTPPAAPHVWFDHVTKFYGAVKAVDDFSLAVARGSFTTLLGPSGCGKTTLLRLLAGFQHPDAGRLVVAGKDLRGIPPESRPVGLVFQDYALFPHMTVRQNLLYGLRVHRVPRPLQEQRLVQISQTLDLEALWKRLPHELSGGQQQRVALGRVVILEPQVLLMDEPLSNLDAKLRVRIRAELKELQQRLGITTVFVTHDQEEALSLSDQIAVLDRGCLQQDASPARVYHEPANRFTADFVGLANFLPATVRSRGSRWIADVGGQDLAVRADLAVDGSSGAVVVRPEQVVVGPGPSGSWSARGRLVSSTFFGPVTRWSVDLGGLGPWVVEVTPDQAHTHQRGDEVVVTVPPDAGWWLGDAPKSSTPTVRG
jgi:ABC-type Fe3+/spermidine/putrescine transport system ATPase subunit